MWTTVIVNYNSTEHAEFIGAESTATEYASELTLSAESRKN